MKILKESWIQLLDNMDKLSFTATPVTRLPYYSEMFGVNMLCKRDDLFMKAGGGSKARMLQYILANVNSNNCDILLTAGGPCSNFNRACALMCASLGIQMHLIEYTDNLVEFETSLNYYVCKLSGIKTTRCLKSQVVETIKQELEKYKATSKRVKYIYGGGKSLEGIFAYYEAVKELFNEHINIDHLFIACGTGTTLTGICAGMHKYFPNAKVHAISTARTYTDEKPVLDDDMNLLNDYLQTTYNFTNLEFYDDFLCGGYAKYNDNLFSTIKECISKEGMIIDPTYSGKAFWGMKNILSNSDKFRGQNILFWNTGGIFNLLSTK